MEVEAVQSSAEPAAAHPQGFALSTGQCCPQAGAAGANMAPHTSAHFAGI